MAWSPIVLALCSSSGRSYLPSPFHTLSWASYFPTYIYTPLYLVGRERTKIPLQPIYSECPSLWPCPSVSLWPSSFVMPLCFVIRTAYLILSYLIWPTRRQSQPLVSIRLSLVTCTNLHRIHLCLCISPCFWGCVHSSYTVYRWLYGYSSEILQLCKTLSLLYP
jgi:hypothetical protein